MLDKNIHSTVISLLNTTGMTNFMIIELQFCPLFCMGLKLGRSH
jgi:hypothetical protein